MASIHSLKIAKIAPETMPETTTDDFDRLLERQRAFFDSQATLSLEFRLKQLKKLEQAILRNEKAITQALARDFRKPEFETLMTEMGVCLEELRHVRKNLARWMRPRRMKTPLLDQPGRSFIYREPLGTVLIIGTWNYPFQLTIAPVIGAIAAGNCVIVKPSEIAANTSGVIQSILSETFPEEYICTIEGGVEETTRLLDRKFDHIFFTGSTNVGKVVMQAAARHTTPVTLELGGKSPAIVCADADLDVAARRVAWGKFMNAGQTCVAPDYLYVDERIADDFMLRIERQVRNFFGNDPSESDSYARIINPRHFDRLEKLLSSGRIVLGGQRNRDALYFAPTVLADVTWTDAVMKEEIFGPILPILRFRNLDDAYQAIRSYEKPLSAYFFSRDRAAQDSFLKRVSFGGGCINETLMHLTNPYLPFGGVGTSGMGSYHGERSFLTFTHEKSVLRKANFLDLSFRYPPYTSKKLKRMRQIFRF